MLAAMVEWFNFGTGLVGGILLSIVGFLLTYRSAWRNKLTKELTISIRTDTSQVSGNDFVMIQFAYMINCTHDEEISLNRMYIKLPEGLQSNTPPNATIGEMFFGDDGKYHLIDKPRVIKFRLEEIYKLADPVVIKYINDKKLKELILVVDTNKYGLVSSNKIELKRVKA